MKKFTTTMSLSLFRYIILSIALITFGCLVATVGDLEFDQVRLISRCVCLSCFPRIPTYPKLFLGVESSQVGDLLPTWVFFFFNRGCPHKFYLLAIFLGRLGDLNGKTFFFFT